MTQFPVIHLNGTGGETLLIEYGFAIDAVITARAELNRVTVHGRDYYPIGSHAINVAMNEHRARLRALDSVLAELRAIHANIAEQQLAHRLRQQREEGP